MPNIKKTKRKSPPKDTGARIQCKLCSKTLKNPETFRKHMSNIHNRGKKIIECLLCSTATFTRLDNFHVHARHAHPYIKIAPYKLIPTGLTVMDIEVKNQVTSISWLKFKLQFKLHFSSDLPSSSHLPSVMVQHSPGLHSHHQPYRELLIFSTGSDTQARHTQSKTK